MHQNNGNNLAPLNKNTPNDQKIEDIKDWRNEHGHPTNKFLQSLADNNNPGAMEKLRSIATDLDVNFNPNTSSEKLIDSIRSASRNNPHATT